jgi:radical SAM protein (TIGR01212 family)
MNNWNGRRYFPISQYFKQRFGERVAKISVSVADTCPNRSGNKLPCIFCDEWGSAAYHRERDKPLLEQIRHNKDLVTRRLKAEQFLVYFQSYTNTLDKVSVLQQRYETALSEPYISGLVIGTRPDCLPKRMVSLLDEVSQRNYVLLELGIQSFFDEQLEFLQRGHTAEQNLTAVAALADNTQVDIGIHLIFGVPGESEQTLIETAQRVNSLPISNVKLHNLHVLKATPLEKLYQRGEFTPLELADYAERVVLFLRHLSPAIAVQRLAAIANRWDELVAPAWTREKMQPIDYIEQLMAERGVFQGDLYQR